jgi:hypothetical protein
MAVRGLKASGRRPSVQATVTISVIGAFGVFMLWRPEEFIRRWRVFKPADKPVLPGGVLGTRVFGGLVLVFLTFAIMTLVGLAVA